MDFVIPLHRSNPIFRATIESIILFYSPKTIYIITPLLEIEKIQWHSWNMNTTSLQFIPEETFFDPLSKTELEKLYVKIDENSREFGWWYQQVLKMGALIKIPNISEPYMVWDSDLIPINRWEIYPTNIYPYYRFAILQESARSQMNITHYKESILELIEMDALEPQQGTFVPHHFIMYKCVLEDLFQHIERISEKPWFISIIELSSKFLRFSEYKCISTFMYNKYPNLLHYHPFSYYGNGLRLRDSKKVVEDLIFLNNNNNINTNNKDISYDLILKYVHKMDIIPTYLQLEHV